MTEHKAVRLLPVGDGLPLEDLTTDDLERIMIWGRSWVYHAKAEYERRARELWEECRREREVESRAGA